MAFLSCGSDMTPLLRLLDQPHRSRPTRTRTFAPAFDVRELPDGFYLDGELPGVDQNQIDIEFTDPHTLVIKGRTERDYHNSTTSHEKTNSSPRWHQPTVEDEDEADADSSDTDTVNSASSPSKPVADQAQPPSFHYWASERSIGQFQRTFTFPARVDQDAVRANLKNGVLSLVVPKQTAPQTKKIRIQ